MVKDIDEKSEEEKLEVSAEKESLKTEKDLKEPEVKENNISDEKSLKDKKKGTSCQS